MRVLGHSFANHNSFAFSFAVEIYMTGNCGGESRSSAYDFFAVFFLGLFDLIFR